MNLWYFGKYIYRLLKFRYNEGVKFYAKMNQAEQKEWMNMDTLTELIKKEIKRQYGNIEKSLPFPQTVFKK